MKKGNGFLDNCSHHTNPFGFHDGASVSNPRVLDYLRILNCERVNATPAAAKNHQRLYRLLFRNLAKRLAVAALLCAACLAQGFNVMHLEIAALNQVPGEIATNRDIT